MLEGCREKFRMECEISTPTAYGRKNGASPGSGTKDTSNRNSSSAKSQLHVEFIENGEVKEKREKYLTAKYGSHQMSLIRKRLSVEMWLYDELQKLYQEVSLLSLKNFHVLVYSCCCGYGNVMKF